MKILLHLAINDPAALGAYTAVQEEREHKDRALTVKKKGF